MGDLAARRPARMAQAGDSTDDPETMDDTGPAGVSGPPADVRVEQALVAERPRLVGLAYRITGSRLDAEDIVQEAWERVRRTGAGAIDRPAAWLTTVVSHLALDHLRSAQHRRETYVGPWLAEPVTTAHRTATSAGRPTAGAPDGGDDPAALVELAESLTFGFLRVLEALSPVERVVFVLADVFATPFPEIAAAIDRSPDACRQIATRARARVRDEGRRQHSPDDADEVADELVTALVLGDTDRVLALLAPDVVLLSDGGPTTHAARRPVVGSDRVARFMLNLVRKAVAAEVEIERTELNGAPAVVVLFGGQAVLATAFTVEESRVGAIHSVVNPDKLAALRLDGPIV